MATSGALADFGRLPTQRKVLVFVVAAFLLGALYWQFFYKSLVEDLQGAEAANNQKRQTDAQLAADIPRYEELKKKVKELEAMISKNQTALPTRAEVPAFFETLERKVTESGVEIQRWRKLNEETVDGFVRVPVEIEMVGTYMQIKRFFASLVQRDVLSSTSPDGDGNDERERIVSIENLALTNPVVENREIILTAKFVAVTFRQEDAAAGTQNLKPVSAPKATAPLPPAATPAGAKARVEQSLDKGDKTDRAASGVDEAKTPAGSGSAALKGGM